MKSNQGKYRIIPPIHPCIQFTLTSQTNYKQYFSVKVRLTKTINKQVIEQLYILDESMVILLLSKNNLEYKFDSIKDLAKLDNLFQINLAQKLVIKKLRWVLQPSKQTPQKLKFEESFALLAFSVLQYIQSDCEQTQRYDKTGRPFRSRRQKILQHIHDHYPEADSIAKLKISALFDFHIARQCGQRYNKQIYSQERFSKAASQDVIIYNPTLFTTQIFRLTLYRPYHYCLLYGNGGIGKSISISLLIELCQIIARYKISVNFEFDQILKHLTEQQGKIFKKIEFFCYLTLSNKILKSEKYLMNFLEQFSYDKQINEQDIEAKCIKKTKQLKKKLNIVIIMDQINIFYQIVKKRAKCKGQNPFDLQNNKYLAISKAYHILKSKCYAPIIFISSEKLNQQLWTQFPKHYQAENLLTQSICKYQISYQRMPKKIMIEQISQIIQIVSFQIQKRMLNFNSYYDKKTENKDKLLKFYQFVEQNWPFILHQISHKFKLFYRQLSHLRVAHYFGGFKQEELFKRLNQIKINEINNEQNIKNFVIFLNRIHEFSLEQVRHQFLQLVKIGDGKKRYEKYRFITQFKIAAQSASDSNQVLPSNFTFQIHKFYPIPQDFEFYVSLDSAQVDRQRRIATVFFSPQSFQYIYQEIQNYIFQDRDVLSIMLQQLNENRSIIDDIFDNSCTNLLTNNQLVLTLQQNNKKETFEIVNHGQLQFINFNYETLSLQERLSDIFNLFEIKNIPQKCWLASKGKQPNIMQSSYNSKVINCLLVKSDHDNKKSRKRQKFTIVTIDFIAIKLYSLLQSKIQNANHLFKSEKAYPETLRIKVEYHHYFVLRKQLLQYCKKILKKYEEEEHSGCTFHVVPIEQMQINFHQELNQVDKLYQQLIDRIIRQQ